MFDLGMLEMLVIGALALIVVGPKDLPGLLRTCGQYVGKMRAMAREFQRSMDDAARQADVANFKELKDVKADFESLSKIDYSDLAENSKGSAPSASPPSSDDAPEPASAPSEPSAPVATETAPKPDPEPAKASNA